MSLLASVIIPQPFTPAATFAVRSLITSSCPSINHNGKKKSETEAHRAIDRRMQLAKRREERVKVENVFVNCLVAASSCTRHRLEAPKRLTKSSFQCSATSSRARHTCDRSNHQRAFSSDSNAHRSSTQRTYERRAIPKEEYLELVNTYTSYADETKRSRRIAKRRMHSLSHGTSHFPLAPRLAMTYEQEEAEKATQFKVLRPNDDEHERQILRLEALLKGGHAGFVSHRKIWRAYQCLPSPRPRYLTVEIIENIFRHLSRVEFKSNPDSHERFFQLFEECVEHEVPLSESIWNSAISFSGRWLRQAHSGDMKSAVETWLRMERAGRKPNTVTFNILFDIAVKSGRFGLAEEIYNQLQARNLSPNRFWRTGMVYYCGLRKDGDAVRQAFRDLVNAGEIVDTAVMNCVIVSLLRAGEVAAAEDVFAKMKLLHEKKLGAAAPSDWRELRRLGIVLNKTAINLRETAKSHESSFFGGSYSTEDKREEVQKLSPIAPDARTYRILLQYHARETGDFDRILELVEEVQDNQMNVYGSTFFHIFVGFHKYGGYAYSRWDRDSLEEIWSRFLVAKAGDKPSVLELIPTPSVSVNSPDDVPETTKTAIPSILLNKEDQNNMIDDTDEISSEFDRAPYYTFNLVLAILQAFHQCAGRRRMLGIWEMISHDAAADLSHGQRILFHKMAAQARKSDLFDWPDPVRHT